MIEVVFGESERVMPTQIHNRASMLMRLKTAGVDYTVVEKPSAKSIILYFDRRDSANVTDLPASVRDRLVLMDDGPPLEGAQAEFARRAAGFLGLVESSAWRKWRAGVFVAWGLFGREDVAKSAGMVERAGTGLQSTNDGEDLSTALARFLTAAEQRELRS